MIPAIELNAFPSHCDGFGDENRIQIADNRAIAGTLGKRCDLDRSQSGATAQPCPSVQLSQRRESKETDKEQLSLGATVLSPLSSQV